jgi:hypothetical protein
LNINPEIITMTNRSRIELGFLVLMVVVGLLSCTKENTSDPLSNAQTDKDSTLVYFINEKFNAVQEAQRLGQWYPASDFEPVGLYLPPGQPIEIDVRILEGNSQPKLFVGTYSRVKWHDLPNVYSLDKGSNSITDSKGGLLYLKYVSHEAPTGKVEVTFKGGESIPVYKLGETSHEEWLQMLSTMTYRDAVYTSNRTMVVARKQTALKYKDLSQDDMLTILDSVSNIEDYISGLDGSSDLHKPNVHKLLITETTDESVFMAASRFRVMFYNSASNRVMDPVEAATEAWGLWHEMGHMRQMVSWSWDEVDEVTVNIYSLAAKRGLKSKKVWLEGHETWDILIDYFKVPLEEKNYNTSTMLTGKGRLAMLHQLWMAYGDEFYIKVHQLAREENVKTPKRDDKMAYFMLISSKACGYNLKDFFIQWGFKLPQEAFDALDALNLPEPEIDLLKLRE